MNKSTLAVSLGTCLAGISTTSQTEKSINPVSKKPNILFILTDDLDKEWISNQGAELVSTTNIDMLAKTGLKFSNFNSTPKYTPSRVTLTYRTISFSTWLGGTVAPTPEAIAKLFPPMKGKSGINLWQSYGRITLSPTAYLRMVLHWLCGIKLETDGFTFHPTVPAGMSPVAVYELPYRQAELEIHITGEGQKVRKITINGQEATKIPSSAEGKQMVEIQIGS